jgi:hypothetical protein
MPGQLLEARAVVQQTVIEAHDCPSCGVIYGITADYYELRRTDGEGWHCPNGHSIIATNTILKDNRQLRERNLDLRARLDQAEADAAAKKREVARMKKRAKNGLCPCCRRHFMNVQRHISNKHPDFAASQSGEKAT